MSNIVVGDADSLIALTYEDDVHHEKTKKLINNLVSKGCQIIYPHTAILEAITALKRALNLSGRAHYFNKQYYAGIFTVVYVDEELQRRASKIFDTTISKKNTIFDCVVIATAEKLEADAIFSFDNWYTKLGFKLTTEV